MYTTASRRFFSFCIGIPVLVVAGCAGIGALLNLYLASPPQIFAGGDAERLVYAVYQSGPDDMHVPEGGTPTLKDVYTLDLERMEAQRIASDVAFALIDPTAWRPQIAADGRYIAWVDRQDADVKLLDMDSGALSDWPVLGNGHGDGVFLMDGRLVVNRDVDGDHELVIVDIDSGNQTVVEDSWLYAGFALSGDDLVLRNSRDTDVEILGLELSANIEHVDLATGQREWIARNLRIPGDGGALYAADGRAVWSEYKESTFDLRIRSYDLESGELETLVENADFSTGEARLCGAGGDQLLLQMSSGDPLFGETVWLETLGFDGQRVTIAELGNMAAPRWSYLPTPRMIDHLVVWTDPHSGVLQMYDSKTRQTESFNSVGE